MIINIVTGIITLHTKFKNIMNETYFSDANVRKFDTLFCLVSLPKVLALKHQVQIKQT